MQLLHECRDSRDDHFESRSHLRSIGGEHSTSVPNDIDDFESSGSHTINEALLEHLQSIDHSCTLHVKELQDQVNYCLQEAQSQGVFIDDQNHESLPDQLGCMANNVTFTCEQDWRREYEQRKQNWKTNIIREQEHGTNLNCEQQHAIPEAEISMVLDKPVNDQPSLNNMHVSQS